MYLTYDEYQDLGGALDETTFTNLEFEARTYIDWYTFNRLANEKVYSENVKRCMYKLIELVHLKAQSMNVGQSSDGTSSTTVGGAITSQTNDGFSITFNALSAQQAFESAKDEVRLTIQRSLGHEINSLGQKLLYRGYYPNE